jgi:hypothetical protein
MSASHNAVLTATVMVVYSGTAIERLQKNAATISSKTPDDNAGKEPAFRGSPISTPHMPRDASYLPAAIALTLDGSAFNAYAPQQYNASRTHDLLAWKRFIRERPSQLSDQARSLG